MKYQRGNSSSKSTKAQISTGVKAVMIRKNTPEEAILRRIKEYLLYTKLRSLIPAQTPELRRNSEKGSEAATEIELEGHEIPERDSDEEIVDASSSPSSRRIKEEEDEEEEEEVEKGCSVVIESGEEQEEGLKKFVPSIRIKKMDGSLLISTIVLKDIALTSALFRILEEEEGIDIVFENQYRTEGKVAHTIQVKVNQPDYNVDLLEKKLCRWAGKPM